MLISMLMMLITVLIIMLIIMRISMHSVLIIGHAVHMCMLIMLIPVFIVMLVVLILSNSQLFAASVSLSFRLVNFQFYHVLWLLCYYKLNCMYRILCPKQWAVFLSPRFLL